MKHKKVFSVLLTGALLFSQTPVSHGADSAFPDLAGHWAESVMLQAYQNQLLLGENGRMNPDGTLTRAQLAAIVNRAFGAVDEAPMDTYTDVAPGKWYAGDMARALKMGTLAGSGSKMMPEDPVTREQAMTVLARALALEDGTATDLGAFVARYPPWPAPNTLPAPTAVCRPRRRSPARRPRRFWRKSYPPTPKPASTARRSLEI